VGYEILASWQVDLERLTMAAPSRDFQMWFSCPYIDRDGPHTYAIGENPSRTVNDRLAHPAVPSVSAPHGCRPRTSRVPALPTSTSRLSVLSEIRCRVLAL
jgi:hypothetical protein